MITQTKPLSAGALRHRIAIDRQDVLQDADTGEMVASWVTVTPSVPASVQPLSGREFIAAAQQKSRITARIQIRYRPDLDASMRIRHDATIYSIQAILPDNRSGKEWLTLLVESK